MEALHGWPLRLPPGVDLRSGLVAALPPGVGGAFVVSGIGSLVDPWLRFADAAAPTRLAGKFEIVSLAGSLSRDGAHLHIVVADAQGRVRGGHLAPGSLVHTTAEVLLALLPGWVLSREPDAATGFSELVVKPRP